MELKEAKKQLESLREDRKSFCCGFHLDDEIYLKDIEAIDTVLQELKRLQRENEELKTERNVYRTQVNSAFDKGFIHKDKIKDMIVNLKVSQENTDNDNLDRKYQYQIEILEKLLKCEEGDERI